MVCGDIALVLRGSTGGPIGLHKMLNGTQAAGESALEHRSRNIGMVFARSNPGEDSFSNIGEVPITAISVHGERVIVLEGSAELTREKQGN